MRDFLDQINAAVGAGLFYVALHSALAIPDICAALESPSGTTSGERYADWFDRFVANKYTVGPNKEPSLTGDQCYQFRCALLHQGRLQPDRAQGYSRMFFLEPNGGLIMHNNVMGDALNIDVRGLDRGGTRLIDDGRRYRTLPDQLRQVGTTLR